LNFSNNRLIDTNGKPCFDRIFVIEKIDKMKNKKIALVTGGSRGLGKDMALRLAERGIDVILTYNSQVQDAEGVVAQIRQGGQKAAAL
jgi:NADP-dependent 3-hydroxy acid dehydrogenase YdfG